MVKSARGIDGHTAMPRPRPPLVARLDTSRAGGGTIDLGPTRAARRGGLLLKCL